MTIKCPSCKKFARLNLADPEDTFAELNGESVSTTLSVSRETECCGAEVQTATFDIERDIDPDVVELHTGKRHELFVLDSMPHKEEYFVGVSYVAVSQDVRVYCKCLGSEDDAIEGRIAPLQIVEMEDEIQVSLMEVA